MAGLLRSLSLRNLWNPPKTHTPPAKHPSQHRPPARKRASDDEDDDDDSSSASSTSTATLVDNNNLVKKTYRRLVTRPTATPAHVDASNMSLPPFLQQTDTQLTTKFHEIKLLEDERIHDGIVHKDKSKWSMQAGARAFELGRNRYTNIIPYDKNRVILEVAQDHNDYINASHITVDIEEERRYIATQGPTDTTVPHFWQMVLQQTQDGQDVAIVMVTPLVERNVKKCAKYWVDSVGEQWDFPCQADGFAYDLRIKCLDYHDLGDIPGTHYTMLQLDALERETGEVVSTRTIHHLFYDQWTDFMKPGAWEPIQQISNLAGNLNHEENPLIVHCSAGVGRTGTFITLDYLFHSDRLIQQDTDTDIIEKLVKQLRLQRLHMVQSFDQFKFCYEAMFQFFRAVAQIPPFPTGVSFRC